LPGTSRTARLDAPRVLGGSMRRALIATYSREHLHAIGVTRRMVLIQP
jgi:hypothetical protein